MDDVEDSDGNTRARQSSRKPHAKLKYMNMLQEVADRKRDHIYIDLDDLDEVGLPILDLAPLVASCAVNLLTLLNSVRACKRQSP